MANEITVTASLGYNNTAKGLPNEVLAILGSTFTITGVNYQKGSMTVPTTAGGTAIPLGGVSTPGGWVYIKNTDGTNYVQILTAVSGTTFARLYPGEAGVIRLDAGVTAPAALANVASLKIDYMILEN
ncbi:MAG: hypothetical protein KGI27_09930 [Thaumarchaeota archaeon]|nr:hypothetical protein [Nitrososphaerota archaeon]